MKTNDSGGSDPDRGADRLVELQRLLDLQRSGDPSARKRLVEWVERWQSRRMRSKLDGFRALRRWCETGDVMHEVSMKLDAELATRQPAAVAEFLGLVGTLISHYLVDHWRSLFGREGVAGNHHSSAWKADGSGWTHGVADEGAGDAHDPFRSAESAEMIVKLLGAVRKLPEDQKQFIHFKYYQELTLPEIARVMEISLSGVNRLHARARLFLSRELGADDEDGNAS